MLVPCEVYKTAPDPAAPEPKSVRKFVPLPETAVVADPVVIVPAGAAENCKEYPTVFIKSVPLPEIAIDCAVP